MRKGSNIFKSLFSIMLIGTLSVFADFSLNTEMVYASIDLSVFENKTDYDVEIDDFDDTGLITFAGGKGNLSGFLAGYVKDSDGELAALD